MTDEHDTPADDDYTLLIKESRARHQEGFSRDSVEKDKIVVSLTGAALGFSAVYAGSADRSQVGWTWLLISAWIALGLAVVATLVSYELTHRQYLRAIRSIDRWFKSGRRGTPEDATFIVRIRGWEFRPGSLINTASIYLAVVGIIALVVFISVTVNATQTP